MWKFLLSFVGLVALLVLGNRPLPAGTSTLPPIGKFLSPSSGFWQNGNINLPNKIFIPSLKSHARVFLDDRGVPHIFAENYIDALRIQGFLHAHDRLFQMDISSRFTSGRLAEIFGKRMVEIDKLMRRRGLPFAAENALAGWEEHPKSFDQMTAYTNGVNAYIQQLKSVNYPFEYKLLSAEVEEWTPYKTACMFKSMAFDLSFRNEDDLASKTIDLLGSELYNFLFPFRSELEDPVIPPGSKWKTTNDVGLETNQHPTFPSKSIKKKQALLPDEAIGSNNWAVSGSKTKSGAPILCNDPHLRLRLPAIWYEAQIHTPDVNVYGVSIPGVPGIIIGFNEDIAWGFTNVGLDVLDWYKIDWVDSTKQAYRIDNKIIKTENRIEEINIKGQPAVYDTILYTSWGPLTYEDDPDHYLHDYALRWICHDKQDIDEFSTFPGLNTAKNLNDYIEASSKFLSPAQNMIFASVDGDIALRVCGNIPIRKKNQGIFVQDGSTRKNDWQGFVSAEENPVSINPSRGFVSSANQISTDSSFPYPYYGYYADYRGRLLNKKLSQMQQITPEDMMRLQNNDESQLVEDALSALITAVNFDNLITRSAQEKFNLLQKWDGHFNAKNLEPVLFSKWFTKFYNLCWDELLEAESKLRRPEYWRSIELLEKHVDHIIFDNKATDVIENGSDIVVLALEQISSEVDSILQIDKTFNWGKYNDNRIRHLLNIPSLSSNVNFVNGFKYSLNAVNSTHGPSWRMVVEMTEPIRAWGVYPGGQSGHPGHRNYDNMIDSWTKGDYYELELLSGPESVPENSGQFINCVSE